MRNDFTDLVGDKEVLTIWTRDELETVRSALRPWIETNKKHGFDARAIFAENMLNEISDIIIDISASPLTK
jgi:hypothetical protein